MNYYFYDTSSLILNADNLFEVDGKIVISSISLMELENIKTSNKDIEIKQTVQKLTKILSDNQDKFETYLFHNSMLNPFIKEDLEINNDIRILSCAYSYDCYEHPDETYFVTDDLSLFNIANLYFGEDCILKSSDLTKDNYCGYKEIQMNDYELANFYHNINNGQNNYDLLTNEYIILKNENGDIIDQYCWTDNSYRKVKYSTFKSKWFGEIKPLKDDIYQLLAVDSLVNNQINLIHGKAGTGKTYLSLGYLFSLLDKGQIDKIIIFCNTIATKNSAKLGFYPGSRDEKLLDSQIGNLLASKIGSRFEVERLIEEEKLVLLPFSDIRGYDTSGMNAGIYISEAQNLDITLMKLGLERIGSDCICIIDGDMDTQVDDMHFTGINNGMRRVSKVFRGSDIYGQIDLKIIHRSKIAQLAQLM